MLKLWPTITDRNPSDAIARSGLFDPVFYVKHNRLGNLESSRGLGDYLGRGAALGLRPHPLFDPTWYIPQTSSGAARANPLLHYLQEGSRRGLKPNPNFDPAFYVRANPDVRLNGFEPLTHFATRGAREHREPIGDWPNAQFPMGQDAHSASPAEPTKAEWQQLPSRPGNVAASIDVVMPVYGGRAETLRALYRALASKNRCTFELIVIDDASPHAELSAHLHLLAESGHIRLLVNETNRGFTASVNRGMALHPTRDVILLNADTEVFGDWIDRLRDAAYRSDLTGTVSPWSSDATILSYPIRLRPNLATLETSDEHLDCIAASTTAQDIEIPTAVGFCMFIKRACLNDVGLFDERRFGRGYGEENDFCRRALYRGWRSIAASNVYVRHHGGRSFGSEKNQRLRAGLATMAALHPSYPRAIAQFNKSDPLRLSRKLLDEARVRAAAHAHVLSDAALPVENAGVIELAAAAGPKFGSFNVWSDKVPITPNLPPIDPALSDEALASRIGALTVRSVRITGTDARSTSLLQRISRVCELPIYRVTTT